MRPMRLEDFQARIWAGEIVRSFVSDYDMCTKFHFDNGDRIQEDFVVSALKEGRLFKLGDALFPGLTQSYAAPHVKLAHEEKARASKGD